MLRARKSMMLRGLSDTMCLVYISPGWNRASRVEHSHRTDCRIYRPDESGYKAIAFPTSRAKYMRRSSVAYHFNASSWPSSRQNKNLSCRTKLLWYKLLLTLEYTCHTTPMTEQEITSWPWEISIQVPVADLAPARSFKIAPCMSLLSKARAHYLSAIIILVGTTYISFSRQPYSNCFTCIWW